MKIRIDLRATAAAPSVHALAAMADELSGAVLAAAEPLAALVDREDLRTDALCDVVGSLEDDGLIEGEVCSAESDDGELLDGSLEGELTFELEAVMSSRREAKAHGDALLDLLARLSRLELTEVAVKLGRSGATLDGAADAIIELARKYGVQLRALAERSFEEDGDDVGDANGDLDEDDDDDTAFAHADGDDEEDDEEGDDDEEEDDDLDDEGFPAGGWGRAAAAPSARRAKLTADEQLYLELAELAWPCSASEVRSRLGRTLAKRHPDPIRYKDPALADRYEEEYKRLQIAHDALVARCGAEGRP